MGTLTAVAGRRGISRDETVRQLLGEHVERQERAEAGDRLTHISTVLRYPRPPRWRREPRSDRPLRLRLAPGLVDRARAVSLQLPGQSQRAQSDYQGRSLTDAVMTAIAVEEPFTDEFLDGFLPLLSHRAALGLWQLAVAATSTGPELAVQAEAERMRWESVAGLSAEEQAARYRLQLVAQALDEEVGWHSHARFDVATNIARDLLAGANAHANRRLLHEQTAEWGRLLTDLRDGGTLCDRYRVGLSDYDWSGRGGTAVWRAERRVELQDFEDWLTESGAQPAERAMRPPGWMVRKPRSWQVCIPQRHGLGLADNCGRWATEERVLVFPYQDREATWPLRLSTVQPGLAPVPGFETIVRVGRRLRPEKVVGFIESLLIDWNESEDVDLRLYLPARQAFAFELIGDEERRRAEVQAAAATRAAIDATIEDVPAELSVVRAALHEVRDDAALFARAARRANIRFKVRQPVWPWPGGSVADEFEAGMRPDLLEWLAGWAHKTATRALEGSMQRAWQDAFDQYAVRKGSVFV